MVFLGVPFLGYNLLRSVFFKNVVLGLLREQDPLSGPQKTELFASPCWKPI